MQVELKKNKLILITIFVAGLAVVYWLIFYSLFLANTPIFIDLRNFYFIKTLQPIYLPHKLPYSLLATAVVKSGSNISYNYTFLGTVDMVDFGNSILYLKDKDGNTFAFKFKTKPLPNLLNQSELMVSEITLHQDKSLSKQIKYVKINLANPEETPTYFYKGDIVKIFWNDSRALPAIINFAKNKNKVIDIKGQYAIPITKIIFD